MTPTPMDARHEVERIILTERLYSQGWTLGAINTFLRNAGYTPTAEATAKTKGGTAYGVV